MRIQSLINLWVTDGYMHAGWTYSTYHVDGIMVDTIVYLNYFREVDLYYGEGPTKSIAVLTGRCHKTSYDVRDHWSTNN